MQDHVAAAHNFQCPGRVGEVTVDELRSRGHVPDQTRRQVVDHSNRFASGKQGRRQVRADETGTPGDQNCHCTPHWVSS